MGAEGESMNRRPITCPHCNGAFRIPEPSDERDRLLEEYLATVEKIYKSDSSLPTPERMRLIAKMRRLENELNT